MLTVWPATKTCGVGSVLAVAVAALEVGQLLAARWSEERTTEPAIGVAVTLAPAVVGAGLGMLGVVAMPKQKLKILLPIFVWLGQPETARMGQVGFLLSLS